MWENCYDYDSYLEDRFLELTRVVNCKPIAEKLLKEIKLSVENLKFIPCLHVILANDDKSSEIYVRKKREACETVGINFELHKCDSEKQIISLIRELNVCQGVHGILVQLPLPANFDKFHILNSVDPKKDVDCFHLENQGLLFHNKPRFYPCTPLAIVKFLEDLGINIVGKHIVIINNSIVVGLPLSIMLQNLGATTTVCNKNTNNLPVIASSADILITAVGKRPEFVLDNTYCKDGVILIDVGINKQSDGKVVGDVDVNSVIKKAAKITKVPGGIGLLTVCMLLNNVVKAACDLKEITYAA